MIEKHRSPGDAEVLITGGGVAALEAMMALRELAPDRVHVTIVAPDAAFVYRPMMVAEPFELSHARRYPLEQIASDFDARVVHASVIAVRSDDRRVVLRSGDTLSYDTLVLAPGARMLPAFDDAITFGAPDSSAAMRDLLVEVEEGRARRVAFIAPSLAGWTLPLYELAIMTGGLVRDRALDAELILITPEPRPLAVFGAGPSAVVARLLAAAGVEFVGSTYADAEPGAVRLASGGRLVPVDGAVALPLVRGPEIEGVPAEPEFGFVPVDRHGRVAGLEHVYAAGDATDYPIKQGGLAAQQADAVAEHIAAHCGAAVTPTPFTPVLRGMLFAGAEPQFLDGAGSEEAAPSQPLWWPPTKIAGRHLAPYLFERDKAEAIVAAQPPAGFTDVEIALDDVEPLLVDAPRR
jgi:sulfide:quinone oxidoreductase